MKEHERLITRERADQEGKERLTFVRSVFQGETQEDRSRGLKEVVKETNKYTRLFTDQY